MTAVSMPDSSAVRSARVVWGRQRGCQDDGETGECRAKIATGASAGRLSRTDWQWVYPCNGLSEIRHPQKLHESPTEVTRKLHGQSGQSRDVGGTVLGQGRDSFEVRNLRQTIAPYRCYRARKVENDPSDAPLLNRPGLFIGWLTARS